MTEQARKQVADRVKTQCVISNYGLPERADLLGLDGMGPMEARRRLKAIQELWVRLDLWVSTGARSSGSIAYPEAKRRIDYNFATPSATTVKFVALVPDRKR